MIVFALTMAMGLVVSVLVTLVLRVRQRSDDALIRDIQQMFMQMAALFISAIALPVQSLTALAIQLGLVAIQRPKWVVLGLFFTAAVFSQHYYHADILSVINDGWTCTIVPILKNIITPLFQVLRVLYAFFAPLYNCLLYTSPSPRD